jgi:hypothetical protein
MPSIILLSISFALILFLLFLFEKQEKENELLKKKIEQLEIAAIIAAKEKI